MYLIFENTCYACPEQYDVFDIDIGEEELKKQVAYVRLRWGRVTCTVPDVGGDLVYDYSFDDGYQGIFSSEDERTHHLNLIRKAILKHYQEDKAA